MPVVRPVEQAQGSPERVPEGCGRVPEPVRVEDRQDDDGGPHAV